jgi:hypothetical protein
MTTTRGELAAMIRGFVSYRNFRDFEHRDRRPEDFGNLRLPSTLGEFRKELGSSYFLGATALWRVLELQTAPDPYIRRQAMKLLRQVALNSLGDCLKFGVSPAELDCFRYCGINRLPITDVEKRHKQ